MFLIFDTETTGLPKDYNAPVTNSDNWPRMVQIAWQVHDEKGQLVEVKNYIVKPEGYDIPFNAVQIHGISTHRAQQQGVPLEFVLEEFEKARAKSKFIVGHNITFDLSILGAECHRKAKDISVVDAAYIDTKDESTDYCAIPGGKGGKFKWPTLTELHHKLFGNGFGEAHNAAADVEATARCFLELVRLGVVSPQRMGETPSFLEAFREVNPAPIEAIGLNIQPYSPEKIKEPVDIENPVEKVEKTNQPTQKISKDVAFSHLHNHTQFSILQATPDVSDLVKKAGEFKMPAVALTDTGNMMGAFQFVDAVAKHNDKAEAARKEAEEKGEEPKIRPLIPIVGCELNICRNHLDKSLKDNGSQVPLIAKNKDGYHNLAKLASIGQLDGFYYVPRIDKNVLVQYKENLIAFTGSIYGEIPNLILNVGEAQAEEAFVWWKEQFGEDFYAELIRHGLDEENHVNEVLLRFCKKHDVKYFASNNTFYTNREDSNAHDILLCVKDGEKKDTPIGKGRGFRFGFPNSEFYFKSQEEMAKLFSDLPEAISTTNEIVGKIEPFKLKRDVLLPKFDIPEQFRDAQDEEDGGKRGENNYLRHLTYEGAKARYSEITDEIKERLDFELSTIERTGYPGYFLIVQDFTNEAKRMGVSVGPGRGSAAGSAVAYCIGITNVDPIKYDLLFERFLNPDRVSLPDIDIDFDDEGRGRIIDWVVKKYGSTQVAQIITYGTMAAKSSIRDTARVLDLPLPDADRLAKLVPDNIKLDKILNLSDAELKEKLNRDEDYQRASELRKIAEGKDLAAETIRQAAILEGSLRNTGVHACGVIITPDDISKFIPIAASKDSELAVTQFDNSVVESAGLLKMDFLGLKTLTIIKDALKIIKARHGIEIDIDTIPLDDEKTYQLYQRGETNGTFQFESPGMQKYLRELKPDTFADLIAMNALYRPGPLEYIPNFIRRKHGQEEIIFDLPDMEEYLKETYGITVYQEQVMLLSQKLADFTKGEADTLRKAMGKKQRDVLDKMKPKFISGATAKGHPEDKLNKIWTDWEAFAQYAFNKSHSTCYAYIAYQTAYLKAHYPAEYMASVLTNNMNDIKKVTFFMEECRRMGLKVLGPDVNESYYKFAVNKQGEVRFGLGALKGVGENAVNAIVEERKANGPYVSVYDLVKRIDLKSANRKALECIAQGGGYDSFEEIHRAQYFAQDESGQSFLDKLVRFGANVQNSNNGPADLFGDTLMVEVADPVPPTIEEWSALEKLSKEKEVVGVYISGHPLDDYRLEINAFCHKNIAAIKEMNQPSNDFTFAGIITNAEHRTTKNGAPFGTLEIEDYDDNMRIMLFQEDYLKFKHFFTKGLFVFMRGRMQKPRFGEDRPPELKITAMELLGDIKEKMAKGLHIELSTHEISEDFSDRLLEIVGQSKGKHALKITLRDSETNARIEMQSRSLRINLNNELIDKFKELDRIQYKLF
jgi:DNA polymerase III subunit alpha